MSCAIIDNAILTAVQRLLGGIRINNKYTLDGDILAFETLIQTILFFDDVYYVNDYKEKYKNKRSNFFPYLGEISIEQISYDELLKKTGELSNDIIPCIEGGIFTDDNFKPFFDLLKMHNIFTWDLSSSVYYLTQKMLAGNENEIDIEKYSKLSQMIFNEFQDDFEKNGNKKAVILDSRGNPISSKYTVVDKEGKKQEAHIGKQTELFMANLSWLAYRTIFYTLIANKMGGTLILHPIRNAFQINYLKSLFPQSHNMYKTLINAMNAPVEATVNSILKPSQPLVTKYFLPMFSVALTNKTKNPIETINEALRIKEEGLFVEARRRLLEIEQLCLEEKNQRAIIEANKQVNRVEKLMQQISEKYYISTPQGVSLSPIIEAYNIGSVISQGVLPPVPRFSAKIKIFDRIKDWIPQRGFNAIYKSLINDLTSISRLGEYHELLTSKVVYSDKAEYYSSKMENEQYRYSKSYWKIPM